MGSVVCWELIGAPGPRLEAGTPLASFLGPGAENLADISGVCLTPLVSAVAQELTRAAQRALEAAAAISSQSPEGME